MQLRRLQLQDQRGLARRDLTLALGLALLAAGAFGAGSAPADDEAPSVQPPTVQMGLPVGDGTVLWAHPGNQAPPDGVDQRFRLEPGARRIFRGRPVEVLRYVPRTSEGERGAARGYAQADFVDPSTGEIVGGLDGWGHEQFPDEGDRPPPCPGR